MCYGQIRKKTIELSSPGPTSGVPNGVKNDMTQWEYAITIHELPESPQGGEKPIIKCDQAGQCFVHDASRVGIEWLENIFSEQGKEGWELVQSGYHHREFLCIWKKKRETRKGN